MMAIFYQEAEDARHSVKIGKKKKKEKKKKR
jgi:hypothetical protein